MDEFIENNKNLIYKTLKTQNIINLLELYLPYITHKKEIKDLMKINYQLYKSDTLF